ncbi:MAG: hypothetical protein KY466_16175 [Gemmatimonadetes bacterium]|nr:hypothetical protein [Gemmatimonadota bacterium]
MRRRLLNGALGRAALAAGLVLWTAAPASAGVPVTLRGSSAAMERQHAVAIELGFRFVRTRAEMARLEAEGDLVRMEGNDEYGFREGVSSLVARPETRTFVERLARDYQAACGEKLVVTSLTRPTTRQPRNAHRLSVHPAGIAVDLRVSSRADCRNWLEGTLLAMEEDGALDVTRERYPPHYHVALFPEAYMALIQPELEAERALAVAVAEAEAEANAAAERAAAARAAAMTRSAAAGGSAGAWLLLGVVGVVVPAGLGAVATLRRRSADPDRAAGG